VVVVVVVVVGDTFLCIDTPRDSQSEMPALSR